MRKNGEKEAADSLEDALTHGRIFVEDDPNGYFVRSKVGLLEADATTNTKTKEITIGIKAFVSKARNESVLIHESVHLREAEAGLPSQEQMSTRVAEAYDRRRSAQLNKKRDNDYSLWDSYAETNVKERSQFAKADGPNTVLYLWIVYHRMFPRG